MGLDEILCRCVLEHVKLIILNEVHTGFTGFHYVGKATVCKILQAGLWWNTLHAYAIDYFHRCDIHQSSGNK